MTKVDEIKSNDESKINEKHPDGFQNLSGLIILFSAVQFLLYVGAFFERPWANANRPIEC